MRRPKVAANILGMDTGGGDAYPGRGLWVLKWVQVLFKSFLVDFRRWGWKACQWSSEFLGWLGSPYKRVKRRGKALTCPRKEISEGTPTSWDVTP